MKKCARVLPTCPSLSVESDTLGPCCMGRDPLVFQKELATNVVAPLHVVQCFLPLLRMSARTPGSDTKVVFVTSSLGSIQAAPPSAGLCETYSVTKAGLGMYGSVFSQCSMDADVALLFRLARKWGASLKKEGICTVLLDPGQPPMFRSTQRHLALETHMQSLQAIPIRTWGTASRLGFMNTHNI